MSSKASPNSQVTCDETKTQEAELLSSTPLTLTQLLKKVPP